MSLSARTAPSIAIFSYIDVLNEVHYVSQLNSSMFLKTCKGLDPNGEVIIKVFIKPMENYDLKDIQQSIMREALRLAPLPTALNFSKVVESNRAGYLIRQHLKSNLYDRLSSRPYLLDVELKFLTFQLLQALDDIHQADITHGDIKTENILVTSWNWLLLADFSSSIKPTYLPEDNPGEFSFYFDTSKRRTCYLAPERFDSKLHESTNKSQGPVTKAMDIFSMGCCIAELNAEGRPLFNLSQLFKYKNKDYVVEGFFSEEIKSKELKSLIMDMIQLNPNKRLSSREIMEKYRGKYFPEYFYTFTYEYFRTLATMSTSTPSTGAVCTHTTLENQMNVVDGCCAKIYTDFKMICEYMGYTGSLDRKFVVNQEFDWFFSRGVKLAETGVLNARFIDSNCQPVKDECALLFISYISHGLRNIVSSITKLRCLEMLIALSQFVSDENKIDRVIPYLVSCFEDEYPNVQALAVQALTQVLNTIKKVNPINEYIFVDYLLPRLKRLLLQSKVNSYTRIIVANCLGDILTVANRFQEISYSSNSHQLTDIPNGGLEAFEVTSRNIKKLVQQVEDLAVGLLTDSETNVKIALLGNILPLCKFFGREKTNDVILSHLITYLNDKDSSLRIKLIQTISGIAILLGPITLEQYILPLLIQTITDSEELVVVNVLKSLKDLCKTGLIQKRFHYDICNTIRPLLLHPNFWIRQYSLLIIVEISANLSKAEVYCVLYPIVRPFFEFDVEFTYDLMLSSCKLPVSRTVYNFLCSWSLRASKSLFWQQVPSNHVDAFGNDNTSFITKDYSQRNYGFNIMKASKSVVRSFDNSEIPLTTEDKNWVDKFKSIGLTESDFWKLAVLRGYILRAAKLISRKTSVLENEKTRNSSRYDRLNLAVPQLMPRTIFFDVKFAEDDETATMTVTEGAVNKPKLQQDIHCDLPTVKDMNGSLMFTTKAAATTTSNLENVYVQLEFKPQKRDVPYDTLEHDVDEQEYTIHDSYEGNVGTIKDYLHNLKILPSLREYKNFGSLISDTIPHETLDQVKGKLVTNLTEGRQLSITALATSSGVNPYLISGSDQGVIKLWDLTKIISGELYTSSLTHDLASPITNIIALTGYDSFCISTKDGLIVVLRVLYQIKESQRKFARFQTIRKFKIDQTEEREVYATTIKAVITDDISQLIALTNTSQILILDIRTMKCIKKISNPVSHGAVASFAAGESGSVLILGTTKGIIDLWDLRFHLLIKSWAFGDHHPITHLSECGVMGKDTVIVVGGLSSALFTVWDYAKLKCRTAVIHSDEQPSIGTFLPVQKQLDKLRFLNAITVNSIFVTGEYAVVANGSSNKLVMVNMRKLNSSRILREPKSTNDLVTVQATASLSYLLLKKTSSNEGKSAERIKYSENINCMASAVINGLQLLITADTSGTISLTK